MTLIIGYIKNNTIQIVSDSAETSMSNPPNEFNDSEEVTNSFGEIIQSDKGSIVNESAQKILTLNNSIVLTYSGSVLEGEAILRDIKYEIEKNDFKLISNVLSNYFKSRNPQISQYIIGYFENRKPTIFCYDTKVNIFSDNLTLISIGNGINNESIMLPIAGTLEKLKSINNNVENELIALISITQCAVLNDLSFQKGVGGYINGLYIHENGIEWAKDTNIILYSSKTFTKSEMFSVTKYNREGGTYICSPKKDKTFYLPNNEWLTIHLQDWIKKWRIKLETLGSENFTEYISFICYDRLIVTYLKNDDNIKKYLKLSVTNPNPGHNKLGFEMHKDLLDKLLTYSVDKDSGKELHDHIGIALNYL